MHPSFSSEKTLFFHFRVREGAFAPFRSVEGGAKLPIFRWEGANAPLCSVVGGGSSKQIGGILMMALFSFSCFENAIFRDNSLCLGYYCYGTGHTSVYHMIISPSVSLTFKKLLIRFKIKLPLKIRSKQRNEFHRYRSGFLGQIDIGRNDDLTPPA